MSVMPELKKAIGGAIRNPCFTLTLNPYCDSMKRSPTVIEIADATWDLRQADGPLLSWEKKKDELSLPM